MATIQPIFVDVWNAINTPMQAASADLIGNLQGVMGGWFVKVVPAYLVVMLFIAMWSGEELAELRFFKHVLLAAVVYTVVSELDVYSYYVTGLVHGTMNGLTGAIAGAYGGAQQTPPQAFNSMAVKCFNVGNAVYDAIPEASYVKGAGIALAVSLYWTLVQFALWIIFALYMCAAILTDYVITYGPIFVFLFFFEPTRMFFDGWFRAVIAGMLAQIFLVGSLSLMVGILTGLMHVIGGDVAPTGADAGNGDIGFMLWDMFGALGLICLFVVIAGLSVHLAIQISGGAHAHIVKLPHPGGSGGGSGPSVPSGPSSGSGGGSVTPTPRTYAFQNTTPMGPAP